MTNTTTPVEVPKVVNSGELKIGDQTFTVHVLDDGRRVFEADDFNKLLGLLFNSDTKLTNGEIAAIAKFIKGVK